MHGGANIATVDTKTYFWNMTIFSMGVSGETEEELEFDPGIAGSNSATYVMQGIIALVLSGLNIQLSSSWLSILHTL